MEWLGHATTRFTHSPTPLSLKKNDGSSTDLLRVCEESTPPCRLNPLLFNGHLQTFKTAFEGDGPPVFYKRKVFEAEDPVYEGSFAVDFVVPPNTDVDESLPIRTTYFKDEEFDGLASLDIRPMLINLHGLSGGSYETYLKHVLFPLVQEHETRQWEACVIISRGCAKSKITSSVLYNARATWDIRQIVKWARRTFPNRPLYGIGFSLGANILTTYIGEEGENCLLKAAVVISNPWNLESSSLALQRTWLGREIYSKTMGTNMKRLVDLHQEQLRKNTKLDFDKLHEIKYLHEFDRVVQGPTWGYPTEGAYYRDASSSDSVFAVRIPMLAINAEDDPIAINEAIPYQEVKTTPYIVLCVTSLGGHLSWRELPGGGRWHARPAINFLNTMAFDIELPPPTMANGAEHARFGPEHTAEFFPMRRKLVYNTPRRFEAGVIV
ncbi:Alpha/Beta hydrolase protein [Amylocarpus encephaloides]|uniref:alcohol O-acetyltransferase n=1 Tax=Amylocarpus encephaloides TaxID=45428 RepID=A0A9P8C3U5_9HELO|nr:Alpha/Beta hydrolase protein [Amylocarpus encephaloides]